MLLAVEDVARLLADVGAAQPEREIFDAADRASAIVEAFACARYVERLSDPRPAPLADLEVRVLSGPLEGKSLATGRRQARAAKRHQVAAKNQRDQVAPTPGQPSRDSWPLSATEAVRWNVLGLVSDLLDRPPSQTLRHEKTTRRRSPGGKPAAPWITLASGFFSLMAEGVQRSRLGSDLFAGELATELRSLARPHSIASWLARSAWGRLDKAELAKKILEPDK